MNTYPYIDQFRDSNYYYYPVLCGKSKGPFSPTNVQRTDQFLQQYIGANQLRPIKEALTPQLIDYFSSMNIEDLLHFSTRYNNQRNIGPLTMMERQRKLARWRQKKQRRQWGKRINYDCRKQVADKRQRIKGRFVRKDQEVKEE